MAKSKVIYVCSECGYETAKWMGKCPSCNAWGTLQEDVKVDIPTARMSQNSAYSVVSAKALNEIDATDEVRFVTNIKEFDRVLGGGIVKGSVVLLSGDPGIGKSTILLQVCKAVQEKLNVLYVSSEMFTTELIRSIQEKKTNEFKSSVSN